MSALAMLWTYCRTVVRTRVHDDRGASVIEYAFLLSLVAVVCIGAISMVGTSTRVNLSSTADKLP